MASSFNQEEPISKERCWGDLSVCAHYHHLRLSNAVGKIGNVGEHCVFVPLHRIWARTQRYSDAKAFCVMGGSRICWDFEQTKLGIKTNSLCKFPSNNLCGKDELSISVSTHGP